MIIATSGGFDPLHEGHIKLFESAAKMGELVVILNSDKFLREKKGKYFMPYRERKRLIESIKYVSSVIPCIDKDQTVCKTLEKLKPDYFVKGGDRTSKNTPEKEVCKKLGIKIKYGVGGKKIQSSSWLLKEWTNKNNKCRKKKYS
jgi:cytidyltransferase-like protein